jgi:hypothetical protein
MGGNNMSAAGLDVVRQDAPGFATRAVTTVPGLGTSQRLHPATLRQQARARPIVSLRLIPLQVSPRLARAIS